jgi:hypothetical protein
VEGKKGWRKPVDSSRKVEKCAMACRTEKREREGRIERRKRSRRTMDRFPSSPLSIQLPSIRTWTKLSSALYSPRATLSTSPASSPRVPASAGSRKAPSKVT